MRKSRIFTNTELKKIEKRQNGDYSDKTGIFAGRIKPKVIELLEIWFPKKGELKSLIKNRTDKK